MKRFTTAAILFAFAATAATPSFAQRTAAEHRTETRSSQVSQMTDVTRSEAVKYASLNAYSDGSGVYLKWSASQETANLGFFVYRFDGKERTLLSADPVAGSAMQVGEQTLYGTEYGFIDAGGHIGSAYVVEALLTNGRRVVSPMFTAGYVLDMSTIAGFETASKPLELWEGFKAPGRAELDITPEMRAEIESHPLHTPDPDKHKWVISQPGVRIGARETGMYRITSAELSAGGFDTSGNFENWQLFLDGVEQSIIVGPGGSYVEFFGKGIDTQESDTRMYYLIEGPSAGKRMESHSIRRFGSTVVRRSYPQTFVYEERMNYVNSILNGDLPNFWGRVILANPVSIPVTVTGIDTLQENVEMTIRLQGFNFTSHSTNVKLNGNTLDPLTGFGRSLYSKTYTIPRAMLVEGVNTFEFQAAAGSQNLFDSISISYDRTHLAKSDTLEFFTENARGTHLRGFTTPNVRLIDLTREDAPRTISNIVFSAMDGAFGADIPQSRPMLLYAFEESSVRTAALIEPLDTDVLSSPSHTAQFVIISHKDFMAESQAWANYRAGQGFSVKVVDVADVMDEFNYGISSSAAITDFLLYAYQNWGVPPSYVLFVGDASYDPKNLTGGGRHNYVPSKMINTIFSETATDEGIADFNQDGLAEIAVGRIPARTPDVVTHMFDKVVAFETVAMQDMNRGAIFAHDINDGHEFDAMSQRIRDELPQSVPSVFISRASPTAQADLVAAINQGQYIVNYAGHGTSGAWAATNFFANSTVPQLTNTDHSIFTMLTCLNGYFVIPGDSLSETLVKSDAGAVAAWASAGLTTPDVQEVMASRFYEQIGIGNITRLGDLIMDAKTTIPGGQDVRLSWVLIGDPMLQVRTPAPAAADSIRSR